MNPASSVTGFICGGPGIIRIKRIQFLYRETQIKPFAVLLVLLMCNTKSTMQLAKAGFTAAIEKEHKTTL